MKRKRSKPSLDQNVVTNFAFAVQPDQSGINAARVLCYTQYRVEGKPELTGRSPAIQIELSGEELETFRAMYDSLLSFVAKQKNFIVPKELPEALTPAKEEK